MTTAQTTREKIIQKGAELIHLKGYNATGLQEILERSGVPKGSFYFYFKSKEDFGLEIIDHFSTIIGDFFKRRLEDKSMPPLERLERLIGSYESLFKTSGFALGCPIGKLALELADSNDRFRSRLKTAVDALISYITACLEEAKRDGALAAGMDIPDAARLIFHGFEGAILHMKVAKSIEPLASYKRYMVDYLRAKPARRRRGH